MLEEEKQLCGIFSLKGISNKNQIKINHIENVTLQKEEYIPDTLLDRYDIMEGIIGEIYSCNITHIYLMESHKLPMLYISVIYERPLRRILLFRVYLYFTIEDNIPSVKHLLNNEINGYFSLEINIENEKKEIEKKITKYLGDEKMVDKLKNFTLKEEMKELIKNLVMEANQKLREEYSKEFEFYEIPKNTISLKNYKL